MLRVLDLMMVGMNRVLLRSKGLCIRLLVPFLFRRVGSKLTAQSLPYVPYKLRQIFIGSCCSLGYRVVLICGRDASIVIADDVSLNDSCLIASLDSVSIGCGTRIAEQVSIRDYDHEFDDVNLPICKQGFKKAAITIGEDVWVGRGVYIGKGVSIGDGAVIGANAVVIRDVPANAVVGGVPARVLRFRGERRTSKKAAA